MPSKPLLSVLIPAYDYANGVKRILDLVFGGLSAGLPLECVVSDDSQFSDVKDMVDEHPISEFESFKFVRNSPSLGAAKNWNSLLDSSVGEFVLFMHHDEFPYDKNFFSKLAKLLKKQDADDVVILKCCVQTIIPNRFRAHVPMWIAKSYFYFSHRSILRRNFIGSPSNLCVRRKCLEKFDPRLKWLIDVDWYSRIFGRSDIKVSFSHLRVVGVFHSNSISAKISSKTSKLLRDSESKIINFSSSKEATFLRDWGGQILAFAEVIIWTVIRLLSIPLSTMMGFNIPKDIIDNNEDSSKLD